jgi:peptidoglycan/xylan/chitin deacetylase (PgdA/CDA1 family)
MHPLKQIVVDGYYQATRPYRALWLHRACAERRAPVMILFYHRVADDRANGWTCSNALFARQMLWLKRHCDVVDLAEAQRRLREGNERPAACVTFDDGYADNNDFALPFLARERIPCTYFVTLGNATTGEPFPHDVKDGKPLQPNTLDDLRRWADAGIEIGAHTRTHPNLGAVLDADRLYDEIVVAGRELGEVVERPIRYFAFPFGLPANMSAAAFELARDAGYVAVCSAYGAYNFPGDDPFHLQRIHADDDFARFRNWLTVDPRKLRVSRYEPQAAATRCVATI